MSDQEKRIIRVRDYTRTVPIKRVTFTCTSCGKPSTNVQYPGREPKYCDTCRPIIERVFARLRKQRQRNRERD